MRKGTSCEVPFFSPKNADFHKMNGMKIDPQQLIVQFAYCPTSQNQYEIDGKKFTVTRHFTGDKDINSAVYALAESRADRETGIS